MTNKRIEELLELYRHTLFEDVVPFWLNNSVDRKHGGFLNCLDRDGSVYSIDKAMWIQCRAVWMFAKLYNEVERKPEWIEAARNGYDFIRKYGFDADGRMFFVVTRDGKPLRRSRYLFTETFGVIACAEYSRAACDENALEKARDLYRLIVDLYRNPGRLMPKIIPETRTTRAHGMSMILLATTQELRRVLEDPLHKEVIDQSLHDVLNFFVKPEEKALFEVVGPNGERLRSPEGRCINPGHAIETSWFMMHESCHRNDRFLLNSALDVLRWSLELGWDKEFGGLLYFVDIEGKPAEQLEWDMKLWWPHTEALYALLLAYHLTGNSIYEEWYERVHQWSFGHFPDSQYGEWFGYLHRDGSLASRLKGSMWKGPFHLPRALLYGWKLLEEMKGKSHAPH
jgi:N-acylglucosamine 2-epimerase